MQKIKLLYQMSFVRYLFVGVTSLGVDYVLLIFCYRVLGFDLPLATTLGFVVGLFVNFLLNKFWSFHDTDRSTKHSFRQAALYGVLVGFNLAFTNIFILATHQLGIAPEISKIITTALTTLWNFVLYKKIIFKADKPRREVEPAS